MDTDATNDDYKDVARSGMVHQTKVAQAALQKAASVDGLLLKTEAVITDKPEEEKAQNPPVGGPGMGGMY